MTRRQMLIGGGGLAALGAATAGVVIARSRTASDYTDAMARTRAALATNPDASEFVRYATLAPNGHNTQPWKFRVEAGRITLLPDVSRRTPVVDPDDHHLFVSLGCAAENLALASAARGQGGDPVFEDAGEGSIVLPLRPSAPRGSDLFDAIPVRQSTRADYDGRDVAPVTLRALATAAASPDVDVVLITDRPQMERVRDLVVAGNSSQMADAAFLRELKSWLRFNPRQALRTGDGLYSGASGNPALPGWLGPLAFDRLVTAGSENDKYARQIPSSAGIAVFVGAREDRRHWVAVGRACQRFALQATALGLKHAYINQPIEVPALRPVLADLIGLRGRRPDIVMRFGYGPLLPYAPRRPVAEVIVA